MVGAGERVEKIRSLGVISGKIVVEVMGVSSEGFEDSSESVDDRVVLLNRWMLVYLEL